MGFLRPDTHTQRILELARSRGVIRSLDLDEIDAPRVALTRMMHRGQLEKVGRGLYRIPGSIGSEAESLTIVANKVPNAVFCLLTALQLHGLTMQLPRQVWIAMPRGSHAPQIAYPPLTMVQIGPHAFSAGIQIHVRDQAQLRVYSVARTLVDCPKFRHATGIDVAVEALREAQAQSQLELADVWRHAQICRMTNVMRPFLESIA